MHIGLRVAVLGLAVSLLSPAPAWAHAGVVRVTPTPGSQLTQPPSAITVTFTEPISVESAAVLDARGTTIATEWSVTGRTMTITPSASAPRGPLAVEWTVTSDDGHRVSGTVGYQVGAPVGPTVRQRLITSPRIPMTLSRSSAGPMVLAIDRAVASGSVSWQHPDLDGPIIWPLTGGSRAGRAQGVLPLPGPWQMTATLNGRDSAFIMVQASVNVLPPGA